METTKANPRALNLEKIQQSKNKVTLGFKCNPEIKLTLANEAKQRGLTLSEYVENIIVNAVNEKLQTKNETEKLTEIIKEQKERIEFYENDLLKKIYNENKNITAQFKNANGELIKLKISSIYDTYTMIINSFRTIKND